jgi:large-conductance mechanosensitive channel
MESHIRGTCLKFYRDFQEWAFTNNIVIGAAAFALGVATKELIEKLLNEALRPSLVFLFQIAFFKELYARLLSSMPSKSIVPFLNTLGLVGWSVLEWMLIIVLTFIILEYFLNRNIIGLKSTIKEDQKKDFAKSAAAADHESIIPSVRDVQKVEDKVKADKAEGKNIIKLDEKRVEQRLTGSNAPVHRTPDAFGDDMFSYIISPV